jgi:hypothetical protein
MKRIFLLLALFMAVACTHQSSRIKGRIADSKGKLLYFEHVDVLLARSVDSITLRNSGKFSFSTRPRTPDFYQLRLGKSQIINLLVKPGESIKIKANGNDINNTLEMDGSFESENLNKLIRYLNETRLKLDSISKQYNDAASDTMKERLSKEYANVLESHRKYSVFTPSIRKFFLYFMSFIKTTTCSSIKS